MEIKLDRIQQVTNLTGISRAQGAMGSILALIFAQR